MDRARREIHHLVDACRSGGPRRQEIPAVPSGVESDSLIAALTAPWDDELESPEEVAAIQEAYHDVERGAIVDDDQLGSLLQQ